MMMIHSISSAPFICENHIPEYLWWSKTFIKYSNLIHTLLTCDALMNHIPMYIFSKNYSYLFIKDYPYPDNSTPGRFPIMYVLILMSGFTGL